jgi:glycosyltransferase involved in cell wall biosynthesis
VSVPSPDKESLLLEVSVPFRLIGGKPHMEKQAHNGLARWMENFDEVSLCAIVLPAGPDESAVEWTSVEDLLSTGRLFLHQLPWGYELLEYFRTKRRVAALFRELIPSHRHLCFSNLGWKGAWGSVASAEAAKQHRNYAVFIDSVLYNMPEPEIREAARRWARRFFRLMDKRAILRSIRESSLGLFHGRSVYDVYAPYSREAHVVHDIHLKKADCIPEADLRARLQGKTGKLRIGYVGRVHHFKEPFMWIDTIARIVGQKPAGVEIEAAWMGDGPLLETARIRVKERGLEGTVHFIGAELDRAKVLAFLRGLDIFLFCHSAPESPRCLIEALMSGLPLLGFQSAYADELVEQRGGGRFRPVGDVEGLADLVGAYLADEEARRRLSWEAYSSGQLYYDEAVFRHRSGLIKRFA